MRKLFVLMALLAAFNANSQYSYDPGKLGTQLIDNDLLVYYQDVPSYVKGDSSYNVEKAVLYWTCDPGNTKKLYNELWLSIGDTVMLPATGYLEFFSRALTGDSLETWAPKYSTTPLNEVALTTESFHNSGPLAPVMEIEYTNGTLNVNTNANNIRVIVLGVTGQVHYGNYVGSQIEIELNLMTTGNFWVFVRGFYTGQCQNSYLWKTQIHNQ